MVTCSWLILSDGVIIALFLAADIDGESPLSQVRCRSGEHFHDGSGRQWHTEDILDYGTNFHTQQWTIVINKHE